MRLFGLFVLCSLTLSAFAAEPVVKTLPRTTDRESLQYKLYYRLMNNIQGEHPGVVNVGISLYYRFVEINDTKSSIKAEYHLRRNPALPIGWSEDFNVDFKLESTSLAEVADRHSLQAILYHALPASDEPRVSERVLSDSAGNQILCDQRDDEGGFSYACVFTFAR